MLNGFVLIGGKRFGDGYRPDEMEVLAFAAHQVGLDLHALRVEQLESQVQDLEQRVALQDNEIVLIAGRRKAPRLLDSATAPMNPTAAPLRSVEV